jgi:hypothetical protein
VSARRDSRGEEGFFVPVDAQFLGSKGDFYSVVILFWVDPDEDFCQIRITCPGRELGWYPVISFGGSILFRAAGNQQLADLRFAESGG